MKNSEDTVNEFEAPSKKKIAKATVIAFVVAVIILFVAVLPAEYGIDPLHTGKLLGLMNLSEAAQAATAKATSASQAPVQPASNAGKIYTPQTNTYKVDSRDLKLGPGEGIEIKYRMNKGSGMLYSWKSTGKVFYEFHGEPEGAPKDYFDSYEKDDQVEKQQSNGAFTAPTTGIHGWFW